MRSGVPACFISETYLITLWLIASKNLNPLYNKYLFFCIISISLQLSIFSSRKSFSTSPSYFSHTICCTSISSFRRCAEILVPRAPHDGDTIKVLNVKVLFNLCHCPYINGYQTSCFRLSEVIIRGVHPYSLSYKTLYIVTFCKILNLSTCLIKHYTIKTYGWVDVYSTSWRSVVSFKHRPLYPRGKSPRYTLDRRPGGPQSQSGRRGGEKILPPPGLELRP
jgi:hypothetical protein